MQAANPPLVLSPVPLEYTPVQVLRFIHLLFRLERILFRCLHLSNPWEKKTLNVLSIFLNYYNCRRAPSSERYREW